MPYIHNRQYKQALSNSGESEKALEASFSKEQIVLFEEYRKRQDILTEISECETYIKGFKLGAWIMIDVLTKEEVNKL